MWDLGHYYNAYNENDNCLTVLPHDLLFCAAGRRKVGESLVLSEKLQFGRQISDKKHTTQRSQRLHFVCSVQAIVKMCGALLSSGGGKVDRA